MFKDMDTGVMLLVLFINADKYYFLNLGHIYDPLSSSCGGLVAFGHRSKKKWVGGPIFFSFFYPWPKATIPPQELERGSYSNPNF